MDKVVKHGALILLLSLFLGFMLGFPSFAMAYVVKPIATLLWAAWRIVSSVHQSVYWAFLIVVCMTLMIRLLPGDRNRVSSSAYREKREPPTRVERWQSLLKGATSGEDESAALRENLRNLLATVISQAEPSFAVDLKTALASTQMPLPPAAQQYLFPGTTKSNRSSKEDRADFPSRTPGWLRRWIGKPYGLDKATIEEVLKWMESYMEVQDDR